MLRGTLFRCGVELCLCGRCFTGLIQKVKVKAWDGVAWALLSALGIATGEATGAVDYLTENVWTPLVAHLKEKWGSMCDVFIDKTNNKSYV